MQGKVETVEEFIARGGKITRLAPGQASLNAAGLTPAQQKIAERYRKRAAKATTGVSERRVEQ